MCSTEVGPDGKTVKIAGKTYTIIKHEVDTIIVPVNQLVYRDGKDIYRDSIVYKTVPSNVDTNDIIKNYYSQLIYKDTLKLQDSLGFITITDSISKNKIKGRTFLSNVNKIKIRSCHAWKSSVSRRSF
jgi:hypothetical protein